MTASGSAPPAKISTVFVVEDEALVALNLEMMLEDLGIAVVGPALRYETALAMAEGGLAADAAILDVNIGGRNVFPIAEKLREQKVAIIFATGYGREGLPPEWQDFPVVQKPYTSASLIEALAGV